MPVLDPSLHRQLSQAISPGPRAECFRQQRGVRSAAARRTGRPREGTVRRVAKALVSGVGLALALPWIIYARAGAVTLGEGPYNHAAFALSVVPGYLGLAVRRAFYRWTLAQCNWDIYVGFGSAFTHPTARVGRRVWVGAYSLIGRCDIADDAVIGSRVSILSGRHQHGFSSRDLPISQQQRVFTEVRIGRDSWLGEGCIIMADLGEGCVVGAGSVVVKPAEDFWIIAGNPARQIGVRGAATPDTAASDAAHCEADSVGVLRG